MAIGNLIMQVTLVLFDIAYGFSYGWPWWWIAVTVFAVGGLVYGLYTNYKIKQIKTTNTLTEEMRTIITTHCLTQLGWDTVGSGRIGDSAVEVWCITPDGKKGKSCIYKVDADGVNCYVNVNNINWGDISEQ